MRLGIDLGGTKIEIVALGDDGRELLRRRIPTPQSDYNEILDAIAKLVTETEASLRSIGSVGVGTPGSISRASGLLRGSNSVCLNGRAIVGDLSERLQRKVRITNDANCFALSEATDGAAAGADVVFGVILGTGVGGGVVVGGSVLTGPNAIAGEWGHNSLSWPRDDERPGPACFCGQRGCVETFLSGPGFERDHRAHSGEVLPAPEIILRAERGEPHASATIERYENRLARALAHVINILDPDAIVLGGGMSNVMRLYEDIPRLWGQWVFSDRVDTKLLRNVHGDSSGVRGAAWLWNRAPADRV